MGLQQRRLLWNFLLLLLVVGLGAAVWWHAQPPAPAKERLLPLAQAEVTRITITRQPDTPQQEQIQLERQDGVWRMLAPRQAEANPARITQLLTLLAEEVTASYAAAGKDLAQYGLQPPVLKLAFNGAELSVGKENPVSYQRYFLHQGQLKLAKEMVHGILTAPVLDWVALQVVPTNRQVKEVVLPTDFTQSNPKEYWQHASALRLAEWDGQGGKGEIVLKLDQGEITLTLLENKEELVVGNKALGLRYTLPKPQ